MVSHIGTGVIVWEAVSGIVGTIIPILLLIFWKRKTNSKAFPAVVGAVIFVIFALAFESVPKFFLFSGTTSASGYILTHTWAYVLTGCLLAGIFEECGRFVGFRFILKNSSQKETAITYGIGHGGMECIIMLGIGAVSAIILASTVNSGAIQSTIAALSDAQSASLESQINVLSTYGAYYCLVGIWERIIAIAAHLSLSVLVFASIYENGRKYLFPAAILLHSLFDVPAVLYQRGVIGLIPTELILTAIVICFCYFAYKLYQTMSSSPDVPRTGSAA